MKLKGLSVDSAIRDEGDWVDAPEHPGLRLKVRSTDNVDYRNALQKANRALRRRYGDDIPVEAMDRATAEALARHILTDWEGVYTEDGKELPFSEEAAVEALTDPDNTPLAVAVSDAALRISRSARANREEDLGN